MLLDPIDWIRQGGGAAVQAAQHTKVLQQRLPNLVDLLLGWALDLAAAPHTRYEYQSACPLAGILLR